MAIKFSLAKSLKLMRKLGYDEWKTEVPASQYRPTSDLYGFLDAIGMKEGETGLLGIQACGEDVQKHIKKYLEGYTDNKGKEHGPNEHLPRWLRNGNRFFIWAWRLRKHEGTKDTYQLREIEFILKDGQVVAQEITREEKEC